MTEKSNFWTWKSTVIVGALFCCLLWGTAFPLVKLNYEQFAVLHDNIPDQVLLAGYRFLGAGFLLLVFEAILHKGCIFVDVSGMGKLFALGMEQTFLQYVFLYIAMTNLSGAKGSILNATSAFMGVILAHFFCKGESMNRYKAVGCIIGFTGIFIINFDGSILAAWTVSGDGFMLLSAMTFALGNIISKHITAWVRPITVAGWQMLFGGGAMCLMALTCGANLVASSNMAWGILSILVLQSAVSFSIWTQLLKYNDVSKISIYNCLVPVFGSLSSAVLLNEQIFNLKNLVALICVSLGILFVNINLVEKCRSSESVKNHTAI